MLKKLLLLSLLISPFLWSFTYDEQGLLGLHYGPNVSWTASANTPFVWGQWLPQLNVGADFNWIEPMGDSLAYGGKIEDRASFLRLQLSIDLSPFYTGFMVGLGIRPFQTNPQVEVRFLYSSSVYFNSNIEMILIDSDEGTSIADSWNAEYILDHAWTQNFSTFDFSQSFNLFLDFDYVFKRGTVIGLGSHFTLTDIMTKHDNKSYDYARNIPVFSRDYILELIIYNHIPLNPHWKLLSYFNAYQTGFLRSNDGTVLKESLNYGKVMAGFVYLWKDGKQAFSVTPGFWMRPKKETYNGSLVQQFIIHLQYQGSFSFLARPTK